MVRASVRKGKEVPLASGNRGFDRTVAKQFRRWWPRGGSIRFASKKQKRAEYSDVQQFVAKFNKPRRR